MSNAQENKPQQYFIYHNREGYSDVYESEEKIIKEKPDMHVVKFADYQRLLDANKKLREGLEFYADGEGDVLDWDRVNKFGCEQDRGWKARQTLSEADKIEGGS